jgi:hypothetical protein
MAFAVVAAANRAGKYTVRVLSTAKEALAGAKHLRERGSWEVIITADGIGNQFSIDEFEALFAADMIKPAQLNPMFQAH